MLIPLITYVFTEFLILYFKISYTSYFIPYTLHFVPYASYFVLHPLYFLLCLSSFSRYYINRVISQRNTTVVLAVHPDIFLAETLQASARPDSLFRPGNSGLSEVLQHFERSAEWQGDNLFFGIKNLEAGRQQGFQFFEREVLQSVSGQGMYLPHILLPESTECKNAAVRQKAVATGEEPFRIGKPLQGGAGRYQVRPLREIKRFRVTRQKADGGSCRRASAKWRFGVFRWRFGVFRWHFGVFRWHFGVFGWYFGALGWRFGAVKFHIGIVKNPRGVARLRSAWQLE